jgi:hypothetical protein
MTYPNIAAAIDAARIALQDAKPPDECGTDTEPSGLARPVQDSSTGDALQPVPKDVTAPREPKAPTSAWLSTRPSLAAIWLYSLLLCCGSCIIELQLTTWEPLWSIWTPIKYGTYTGLVLTIIVGFCGSLVPRRISLVVIVASSLIGSLLYLAYWINAMGRLG